MHGYFIIRNDLTALQVIKADDKVPHDVYCWCDTQYRSLATCFGSEDAASEVLEKLPEHKDGQAVIVDF